MKQPDGSVRLEERAVHRVSGVRVASGNLWLRPRTEGAEALPSAMVFVGQEPPVTLWEGDGLDVSGVPWRVRTIQLGTKTNGWLVLEPAG